MKAGVGRNGWRQTAARIVVAGRDVFAEAVKAGRKFDLFDKVNGTAATRLAIQAGRPAAAIVDGWKAGKERFRREWEKDLLY